MVYTECVAAARVRMNEVAGAKQHLTHQPTIGKNVKSRTDEEPFEAESEGCKEKKRGSPFPSKCGKGKNEATSGEVKRVGGMKSEDGDINVQFLDLGVSPTRSELFLSCS